MRGRLLLLLVGLLTPVFATAQSANNTWYDIFVDLREDTLRNVGDLIDDGYQCEFVRDMESTNAHCWKNNLGVAFTVLNQGDARFCPAKSVQFDCAVYLEATGLCQADINRWLAAIDQMFPTFVDRKYKFEPDQSDENGYCVDSVDNDTICLISDEDGLEQPPQRLLLVQNLDCN